MDKDEIEKEREGEWSETTGDDKDWRRSKASRRKRLVSGFRMVVVYTRQSVWNYCSRSAYISCKSQLQCQSNPIFLARVSCRAGPTPVNALKLAYFVVDHPRVL